jgi:hypothetical protein
MIGLMRCPLCFEAGGEGMLTVETIGRIRHEHLLKGKTIKAIARRPEGVPEHGS